MTSETCEKLLQKDIKKYGYLPLRTNRYKPKKLSTKLILLGMNFIPVVNLLVSIGMLGITINSLKKSAEEKEKFYDRTSSEFHCTNLKREIIMQDRLITPTIKDALKLDGATEDCINTEYKKALESNKYKVNDKQREKIESMNEAELWLTTIQMDTSLSAIEKKKLFSAYVKDFSNQKENAKPKAIKKTLKMISNRHI